jgi:hypothetical protein
LVGGAAFSANVIAYTVEGMAQIFCALRQDREDDEQAI